MAAKPHLPCHFRQRLLSHQGIEAHRKLAGGSLFVDIEQACRNDQAKHPISKEFQPLVIWPAALSGVDAWMAERLSQQVRILEAIAQQFVQWLQGLLRHA